MPKERMSLLDCVAMTKEIRHSLLGLRLANVYNLTENGRSFVFKFSSPLGKLFLLVESGKRFHLTNFAREQDLRPSNFAMKLRKHIRTRRLEKFTQVGADREIDMQFGTGEHEFHVVFQLYASGNIMLTDGDYRIMNLLRVERVVATSADSAASNSGKAAVPSSSSLSSSSPSSSGIPANAPTEAKIAAIEAEMARTQKNKSTNAHLGSLRAKIAKLRKKLIVSESTPDAPAVNQGEKMKGAHV
jgi:predicted ribosome quality control (RQC) complex YloA/Tae2 family protein